MVGRFKHRSSMVEGLLQIKLFSSWQPGSKGRVEEEAALGQLPVRHYFVPAPTSWQHIQLLMSVGLSHLPNMRLWGATQVWTIASHLEKLWSRMIFYLVYFPCYYLLCTNHISRAKHWAWHISGLHNSRQSRKSCHFADFINPPFITQKSSFESELWHETYVSYTNIVNTTVE